MRNFAKPPVVLTAAVALALALAGCGGDDAANGTAASDDAVVTEATTGPVVDVTEDAVVSDSDDSTEALQSDVCTFLDNDTITSITGIDFSKAVATPSSEGGCDWDLTDLGGMSVVSVMVEEGDSSYEVNRGVAASMFDDATDVSVSGADKAFSYMGGLVVAMDAHGKYVQVLLVSLEQTAVADGVGVDLASEVAGNM